MRILLAYDSVSGNTQEVALFIKLACESFRHQVTEIHVNYLHLRDVVSLPLSSDAFDLFFLGCWTDGYGRTPPEMKDFIRELHQEIDLPAHVAVFGTGETQWGAEYFCGAVDRMANFFASDYPKLAIEQMPHSAKDREKISNWTQVVLTQRELCYATT